MKTHSLIIGIALICGGAASAQSPAPAKPSNGGATVKDGVVVTGCVAQAPDGRGYLLNDAIMAPAATGRTASDAAATPPADKTVLSYVLDGGNLKGHVGHKVEITGTKSGDKAGKADKASDPAKMDTSNAALDHQDVGGTLKVKSVKMIAASCT
jgi:hypothetical protein